MPKFPSGLSLKMPVAPSLLNQPRQQAAANPQANQPGGLAGKQDAISQQIKDLPAPVFRPAFNAPTFESAKGSGWGAENNGWQTSNIENQDSFIHSKRVDTKAQGKYAGDKIHLSIQPSQVPKAYDAINSLLFSEDSPVDKWKVTDMTRVSEGSRVQQGAQFTLYLRPTAGDSQYTAQDIKTDKSFIEAIEHKLSLEGFEPGKRPDSDVSPHHWDFASYRNEERSTRDGGVAQTEALKREPVFELLSL
ncbi:type III effector phosphothreonine lyase [Pseudovibrio sp. Tun.PSC04-5.I4]|uniref:type III effector phosphothreonine lyase n=1 Tax=Pseudovibrio sp. Tun.PSC04-5.I4 TaxID=1798213 RepID=UPI000891CBF7|nr:type III effector phosphothreonine lyase [Pseudovibrio sp. Tun.PSC04-5.I4]SDR35374.1 phosphothreonine lyase [Pseudovibrio sp. Tun.PSC04-5.I4]